MRVRIDGMAHLPKQAPGVDGLKPSDVAAIKAKLTIQPTATSDVGEARGPLMLWRETPTHLLVPRGFYQKFKRNNSVEEIRVSTGRPFSAQLIQGGTKWSDAPPYNEQPIAVNHLLPFLKPPYGGVMLQANCAFGKTICALRVAYALGRTTLIVVNKNFFMSQWTKEIQHVLPGAKIGYIQGSTCDFIGKDFVIGMVHSLSQKDYPEAVYSYFGLVVVDECHRTGSETFSIVTPKFHAAYRLGVSATPRRKDGTENSFLYNIGHIAYKAKTESTVPLVKLVDGPELQGFRYGRLVSIDTLNSSEYANCVASNTTHNEQCLSEAIAAAKTGRKVMLLSTRMEQLVFFYTRLLMMGFPYTVGWATGQQPQFGENKQILYNEDGKIVTRIMKEAELEQHDTCQIILATKQMIEEGYNNQPLDTIVLCVPIGDIEQTGGRIRRHCKPVEKKCNKLCKWRAGTCTGKPIPVIVDVVNPHTKTERRLLDRMDFYRQIGAKIVAVKGSRVEGFLKR